MDPTTETPAHEQQFDVNTHVPESLRGEKMWERFNGKTLGDVISSGVEARKMIGSSLQIPAEDASDEDFEKFASKTRAKDYDVKLNDKLTWTDDGVKVFKDAMSKAGLTKRQAQDMFDIYADTIHSNTTKEDADYALQKQTEVQSLRDIYKDNFELSIGRANRALKHFGGEAAEKEIKEFDMSRSPAMIAAWLKVAETMSEDTFVPGSPATAETKEGAEKKLARLRDTPEFKNEYDSGHKAAVNEQDRLFRIIGEAAAKKS